MDIKISFDCTDVNWDNVTKILKQVGMGHYAPHLHKKAFMNSHTTVFSYINSQMIGFGRAISDGVYQAALYDIAVVPEYQNRGIGKIILKSIMENLQGCNVILYASPGKEGFYTKHDFRRMKTGMANFINPDQKREKGFTD
ncbi:Acetyltransferase [Desulfamplus magnetovallimortis]|uniref:Acetyltransferase n=1 Tax=Desulfamplus magnetovallimortis TaxID=1246637 RepID=A0A1W1HFC6_9BACT|nr:GNAT family N-acetyltransferase [Desulfamplus magnetovallimortis]SLM31075.1 Acetyltransferase [Desulfamplus magnetovallimortis]